VIEKANQGHVQNCASLPMTKLSLQKKNGTTANKQWYFHVTTVKYARVSYLLA